MRTWTSSGDGRASSSVSRVRASRIRPRCWNQRQIPPTIRRPRPGSSLARAQSAAARRLRSSRSRRRMLASPAGPKIAPPALSAISTQTWTKRVSSCSRSPLSASRSSAYSRRIGWRLKRVSTSSIAAPSGRSCRRRRSRSGRGSCRRATRGRSARRLRGHRLDPPRTRRRPRSSRWRRRQAGRTAGVLPGRAGRGSTRRRRVASAAARAGRASRPRGRGSGRAARGSMPGS